MYRSSIMKHLSVAALTALCACAWSGAQEDVMEAFRVTSGTLEDGEWETAMDHLSSSTVALLDSLSAVLTCSGLEGYGTAPEVLEIMYQEYIDFDGEVTMIFVDGDGAEVTIAAVEESTYSSAPSLKYSFVFERGEWKLDLSNVFGSGFEDALRGSYVQL